jgi:hypothetical protein
VTLDIGLRPNEHNGFKKKHRDYESPKEQKKNQDHETRREEREENICTFISLLTSLLALLTKLAIDTTSQSICDARCRWLQDLGWQ